MKEFVKGGWVAFYNLDGTGDVHLQPEGRGAGYTIPMSFLRDLVTDATPPVQSRKEAVKDLAKQMIAAVQLSRIPFIGLPLALTAAYRAGCDWGRTGQADLEEGELDAAQEELQRELAQSEAQSEAKAETERNPAQVQAN